MIPADIKELAKHDPVVADLLAAGGPFLYREWQQIRNGEASVMARQRYQKARLGVWAFTLFSVAYFIGMIVLFVQTAGRDVSDAVFRSVNGMMYLAFSGYLFKRMRALREIAHRIDAGEFSAD